MFFACTQTLMCLARFLLQRPYPFFQQLKHMALVRPPSTSWTTSKKSCVVLNVICWLLHLSTSHLQVSSKPHSTFLGLIRADNFASSFAVFSSLPSNAFFLPSTLNRSFLTLLSAVVCLSPCRPAFVRTQGSSPPSRGPTFTCAAASYGPATSTSCPLAMSEFFIRCNLEYKP